MLACPGSQIEGMTRECKARENILIKRVIWEKEGVGGLPLSSFLPFYFRVRALFSISPNRLSPSPGQATYVYVCVPMLAFLLRDNRCLDGVYYKVEPSFCPLVLE